MASTAVDGIRHLARIVTIDKTKECNNPANFIHMANPKDTLWWVVAPKTMQEGDKVVYFEIDSLLSSDFPAFAAIDGKKATRVINGKVISGVVLRSQHFRESLSQGLLLPLESFEGLSADASQDEVDAYFDGIVTKHIEDAILAVGEEGLESFPGFIGTTDAERVQNIPASFFETISADDVYATEKIDGTSMTVWRDVETGAIRIANRNYAIKQDALNSSAWKYYRDGYSRYAELFDSLKPGEWVQGELFCNKISPKFKFATGDVADFRAFHASNADVERRFKDAGLWVPILENVTWDADNAVTQPDTITSAVAPGETVEGIVWYFKDGKPRRELGNRAHFKVVSNAFLTKKKKRKR